MHSLSTTASSSFRAALIFCSAAITQHVEYTDIYKPVTIHIRRNRRRVNGAIFSVYLTTRVSCCYTDAEEETDIHIVIIPHITPSPSVLWLVKMANLLVAGNCARASLARRTIVISTGNLTYWFTTGFYMARVQFDRDLISSASRKFLGTRHLKRAHGGRHVHPCDGKETFQHYKKFYE